MEFTTMPAAAWNLWPNESFTMVNGSIVAQFVRVIVVADLDFFKSGIIFENNWKTRSRR